MRQDRQNTQEKYKNINCNSRKSESNELCTTKKNIDEMQKKKEKEKEK